MDWWFYDFNRQPHKMVKHTQTIHRFLPTNFLSVFHDFWGLAFKGLICITFIAYWGIFQFQQFHFRPIQYWFFIHCAKPFQSFLVSPIFIQVSHARQILQGKSYKSNILLY